MSWNDWAQRFCNDKVDFVCIFCNKTGAMWGQAGNQPTFDITLLPNLHKKVLEPSTAIPLPCVDNMKMMFIRTTTDGFAVFKFKAVNEDDDAEIARCSQASALELAGPLADCRVLVFSSKNKVETYTVHCGNQATYLH